MNIAKALKEKNKLINDYKSTLATAVSSNSRLVGAVVRYNSHEQLAKAADIREQLIDLKTRIHRASDPIREKIFRMGELKSILTSLKSMSVQEGPVVSYRSTGAPDVYETTINVIDRDKMMGNIQKEIEELQDNIDTFNALTSI